MSFQVVMIFHYSETSVLPDHWEIKNWMDQIWEWIMFCVPDGSRCKGVIEKNDLFRNRTLHTSHSWNVKEI